MADMGADHGACPQSYACHSRTEIVALTTLAPRDFGVPIPERTSRNAYPLWGRFNGLPRTYV